MEQLGFYSIEYIYRYIQHDNSCYILVLVLSREVKTEGTNIAVRDDVQVVVDNKLVAVLLVLTKGRKACPRYPSSTRNTA